MKQSELIKQLTDKELSKSLIYSQLLILGLAFILSVFLFNHFTDWYYHFEWNLNEIIIYGIFPGIMIVAFDLVIIRIFPEDAYDDGGINVRIFSGKSVSYIFFISLLIAISEELLFRGVLQTTFGLVIASIIFALVHVRYLRKPVLFLSVLFISLLIGYLFLLTENLFVTITTHFIVDFLLGLYIRFKK